MVVSHRGEDVRHRLARQWRERDGDASVLRFEHVLKASKSLRCLAGSQTGNDQDR